jgi:hypothetical protein
MAAASAITSAHRKHHAVAQLRPAAGSSREPAVETDADDGGGQHGGAELLDTEPASGRVLHPERQRQCANQDELGGVVIAQHAGSRQQRHHRQDDDF